jgi:hypothetical protein
LWHPQWRIIEQAEDVIPAKYSGETSQLAVDIRDKGKNIFDFDLKDEKTP